MRSQGHNQNEISEAMLQFVEEDSQGEVAARKSSALIKFAPWAIIVGVLIGVPYYIGAGTSMVILITALVYFTKALLFAVVLYVLLAASKAEDTDFSRCFMSGVLISLLTIISMPAIKYFTIAFVVFILFMFLGSTSIKTFVTFMVLLIGVEIGISIAMVSIETRFDSSYIGDSKFCSMHQTADIYKRDSVQTNVGRFFDTCMDANMTEVSSCESGCFIKEYSCTFMDLRTQVLNCSGGCDKGACLTS